MGLRRIASPISRSRSSMALVSQSRCSSSLALSLGWSWGLRIFSAARMSTSWRRRPTRSISALRSSSGSGRGCGRLASAKAAMIFASRRSVLARKPRLLAKSRTWRGLTTRHPGRQPPAPPPPAPASRRSPPGPPGSGPEPASARSTTPSLRRPAGRRRLPLAAARTRPAAPSTHRSRRSSRSRAWFDQPFLAGAGSLGGPGDCSGP